MARKLTAYLPVRGSTLQDLTNVARNVANPAANQNIDHDSWELIGNPFREGRYWTGQFVQMVAFYKTIED